MKLIKKIGLTIIAACWISSMGTARTASDFFISAPSSIIKLLPTLERMDMIDYFNSDENIGVQNRLDGNSKVISLTPEVIKVLVTPQSTLQIAVLPTAKNDTLIACIQTLEMTGKDSQLKFYSPEWKELKADKYFTAPQWKDWVTDTGKEILGEIEAQVPFMLYSIEMNESGNEITVTNQLETFLDQDQYAMLGDKLKKQIAYKWDGSRYKAVKE